MHKGKADAPEWTFLTNHAHVLLCLARDPTMRVRDIAAAVGITERAVQRIIAALEAAGYVERVRTGRRNAYRIHGALSLRHPLEQHRRIEDLIRLVHGES
ncbi:MAG: ArsR family transcriptional regulator [Candidatus Tectimicrobiota bacterium]|nr:MAG: ArsR family transcriptional regulator [Candidatus Tectomicrobia bacterium]